MSQAAPNAEPQHRPDVHQRSGVVLSKLHSPPQVSKVLRPLYSAALSQVTVLHHALIRFQNCSSIAQAVLMVGDTSIRLAESPVLSV